MEKYLSVSKYIDWADSDILGISQELAQNRNQDQIIEACFIFVRDEISHSYDSKKNPVTVSASEVLKHRTGYCFAKSHLLAALLRANSIPAGLCYQRLSLGGGKYCLHGLNAVYLNSIGWYRIDARGNKNGVEAKFTPPKECLAFSTKEDGEILLPEIWESPLPNVIEVFESNECYEKVAENLPDVEILQNQG